MDALDLSGPVPLFPLPNCVLFPGVVQPLHIFEPRYREMVGDVLEDSRGNLLAMALLQDGWEQNYYGRPAIHDVVCAGRIVAHEMVEDGKYNLLLQGLTRARVTGESKHGMYRVATLHPLIDSPINADQDAAQREAFAAVFARTALGNLPIAATVSELIEKGVSAPRLADVIAFALLQDVQTKQRLLEQLDGARRAEMVLTELVGIAQAMGGKTKRPVPRVTDN